MKMINRKSLILATLFFLCRVNFALIKKNEFSVDAAVKRNKRISDMSNIMFKALKSVLIEKTEKELIALSPKERSLKDLKQNTGDLPTAPERQLRGDKLTKRVQKMIRDKYKANIYNKSHKFDTSRLLNNNESHQPIFKPVYMEQYPRILTLFSTASGVVNISEHVIEDDDSNSMDIKEVFSVAHDGLKTYQKVQNFLNILIYERAELSMEIESFFYNCDKILIGKDEMLRLLALDKYYNNAKRKCDTKSEEWRELDNELLYQSNDFLDKVRRFLLGIDNLRNVATYMSFEAKKEPGANQKWDGISTLKKIESGKDITKIILTLKFKLENLMNGIKDGVNKGRSVRGEVVTILRKMYKLIPLKNDSVWRLNTLLIGLFLFAIIFKKEN